MWYCGNTDQYKAHAFLCSMGRGITFLYDLSVLAPLLFLISINDLHSAIKFCTTKNFVDDKKSTNRKKSP